ncbi:T-cell surface antigen CD2-like [Ambystoma mexicanum]|uniref:T-cell surface antigen CD2-like n=1 Tax=Ambystoma mexicanum TaxID=8296 RepID=UPI0037E7AB34
MPHCRLLPGGSLELSRITPEEAGDYTLCMRAEDPELRPEEWKTRRKCFLLQLQDPVSTPEVNYTCLLNATVQLSCLMENGTDPSYSWSVNGAPSWLPSREVEMSYESVLRNVTCTVKNHVSEEQSHSTDVTCPGEPESFWKRVIRIVRLVLAAIVLVAGIGMVRWHFT